MARITEDGKKAKACADVRRIAVATVDAIEGPMLLRVPATSLKALGEYQKALAKRKVKIRTVVTRVSFDPNMAYPALVFRPVGFLDEATYNARKAQAEELVTKQIIGTEPSEAMVEQREVRFVDEDDEEVEVKKPEAEKPAKKPAAKKKAAAKKAAPKEEKVEEKKDETFDDEENDIFAAIDGLFAD